AVEAAKEHDLAVEVVGLDRARAALEALERRAARAGGALYLSDLHQALALRVGIADRDPVDAGRLVDRLGLGADGLDDLARAHRSGAPAGADRSVEYITEIVAQLAVFRGHDAFEREGGEAGALHRRGDAGNGIVEPVRIAADVEHA